MKKTVPRFEKYVFVCENQRKSGISCGLAGTRIRKLLKEAVKARGLQAKIRLSLSADGQWVTVYLPGNMGRISNHRNAYLHILGLPYEKKSKAA